MRLFFAAALLCLTLTGCPPFDDCSPYFCQANSDCGEGALCSGGICGCGNGDDGGSDGGTDGGADGGTADGGRDDGGEVDGGTDGGADGGGDGGMDGGDGGVCLSPMRPCAGGCCTWVSESAPAAGIVPIHGLASDELGNIAVAIAVNGALEIHRRRVTDGAWALLDTHANYAPASAASGAAITFDPAGSLQLTYLDEATNEVVWARQDNGRAGILTRHAPAYDGAGGPVGPHVDIAVKGSDVHIAYTIPSAQSRVTVVDMSGVNPVAVKNFIGVPVQDIGPIDLEANPDAWFVAVREQIAPEPVWRIIWAATDTAKVDPFGKTGTMAVDPGGSTHLAVMQTTSDRILLYEDTNPDPTIPSMDNERFLDESDALVDPIIQVDSNGFRQIVYVVQATPHVLGMAVETASGFDIRPVHRDTMDLGRPVFVLDHENEPHIFAHGANGLLMYFH